MSDTEQAEAARFALPWTITAAEAPQHPGVTRLHRGRPCEGFTARSFRAVREGRAHTCRNVAYWRFKPLARSCATTGVYCFKHLVHQGVAADMDEAARTRGWLLKVRAS